MPDTQPPVVVTEADEIAEIALGNRLGVVMVEEDRQAVREAFAAHRLSTQFAMQARIEEALADHFPTGLRSEYARTAGGMPVKGGGIVVDCKCGHRVVGTDEHEARQLWAAHTRATLSKGGQSNE